MLLVKGQERGETGEVQGVAPGMHVDKKLESGTEGITAGLGAVGAAF